MDDVTPHRSVRSDVVADADLVDDLRRAVAEERIEVAYQPIIELQSARVVKVEALARWRRDDGTQVSPGVFIPLAEEHGIIRDLDLAVLRRATEDLAVWRHDGHATMEATVNFSAITLATAGTSRLVLDALDRVGLPADALWVEATETVLVDDAARAGCRGLSDIGIRLALDDIGKGFSTLSYLLEMQVDAIKIDRCFTASVSVNPAASAVVHAIVGLGRDLGIDVIAEGVETEEVESCLRLLGVQVVQGFRYSRPTSAAEVTPLLDGEGSRLGHSRAVTVPVAEEQRLAELKRLGLPDAVTDHAFRGFVHLAADLCVAPMAVISIVDSRRQWLTVRVGLDIESTSRAVSFCSHAILTGRSFTVEDARNDERFSGNPLVAGEPRIRFYAGAPLVTWSGHPIGTLCVLDRRPRRLEHRQLAGLAQLARLAVDHLELRHVARIGPGRRGPAADNAVAADDNAVARLARRRRR